MANNLNTEITAEMKRAYLDYAMSVIVSRALPDVRDGLKPVHRKILYDMYKLGLTSGAHFAKSAKVVGDVLGKYHPHGDAPVYEALARMAQDFSMRYPLVKGQGNFGSVDGDPPAAMRYTEVKLAKIADEMLADIEKETVPMIDNFDGSLKEPLYLPAKLPNLLLMGAEGIAVGMATKIPPHNLTEIVNAILAMIDKAKINAVGTKGPEALLFNVELEDLLQHVKGPDFPTAGIIYGATDIREMYATGRGSILIRAKVEDEDLGKGKMAIIVKDLPYQVNKATLVEKIARLVTDKKIVGISDLRDESNREGIRIVIELKRDASYKKVLNNLFKYTELQTSFPVNIVCLEDAALIGEKEHVIMGHRSCYIINIIGIFCFDARDAFAAPVLHPEGFPRYLLDIALFGKNDNHFFIFDQLFIGDFARLAFVDGRFSGVAVFILQIG